MTEHKEETHTHAQDTIMVSKCLVFYWRGRERQSGSGTVVSGGSEERAEVGGLVAI